MIYCSVIFSLNRFCFRPKGNRVRHIKYVYNKRETFILTFKLDSIMMILRANMVNEVTLVVSSGFSSLITDTMYRTLSNSITRAVWSSVALEVDDQRLWP